MRKTTTILAILMSMAANGCHDSGQPPNQKEGEQLAGKGQATSLPRAFYDLLREGGRAGSLSTKASCNGSGVVDRSISPARSLKDKNLTNQVAELISTDRDLSSQESAGLVRILDKSADAGLLRVHLAQFKVSAREPDQILNALWSMPEVITYMHEHSVDKIQTQSHISAVDDSIRPIDFEMRNVSVQDVLDQGALQFKAMWVYMECTENTTRFVSLDLAQL